MAMKSGIKDSGVAMLVGVVAGAANEMISRNSFASKNWWMTPGVMAIVGAFMNARGMSRPGGALCGAAGYAGYFQFRMRPQGTTSSTETGALMNRGIPGRGPVAQLAPAMPAQTVAETGRMRAVYR